MVQGAVNPDEFYCFKPFVDKPFPTVFHRNLGEKEMKMIYAEKGSAKRVKSVATITSERQAFSLNEQHVEKLAEWCFRIETHYKMPMDIEWALDGQTDELFIVQARPETVHGKDALPVIKEFKIKQKAEPIVRGKAVGRSIVSGQVRIVQSLADASKVNMGDIIVADITNPDWTAMLRKAVSIVTNKGGRTSHASIIARELGIHAIVGAGNATEQLKDGQMVAFSCIEGDEGRVYDGKLDWETWEIPMASLPVFKTKAKFILADPDKAFRLSKYPNSGVGLLRMEFIFTQSIQIHPMALVQFDQLADGKLKRRLRLLPQGTKTKSKSLSISYPRQLQL